MVRTFKFDSNEQLTPHFNCKEFRCKCGGKHDYKVSMELVEQLEKLYAALDCLSINISSGFRCVQHDKNVGGSGTGQHTLGKAADLMCVGSDGKIISSQIVCCTAQDLGFKGIANINQAYSYTHLDMRDGNTWYGDETKGNSYCITPKDFYQYFGKTRKEDEMALKGIDVSACQKSIDWTKVQTDFAIIRAGYGRYEKQKDSEFEANYAGAKKQGIPVGAYWYSYAVTPEEASAEADVFLKIIKGKQFEYPVFYDVEESKQLALGKEKVSAIIRAFLEKVEKAGYWVGLYMSASPLNTHVADDIKSRYTIWVANVGVTKPSYSGAYGIWQYSWKGNISGIIGDVDLDYCYNDYPEKIKAKGLNGFSDSEPVAKKTIAVTVEIGGVTYKGTLESV